MNPLPFWHYTCDHGRAGIGESGEVKPLGQFVPDARGRLGEFGWLAEMAWFTSQVRPDRRALGLTSTLSTCDRIAHRYRVLGATGLIWWPTLAVKPSNAVDLEKAPGARPVLWWVSFAPVPVELDAQ